MASYDLLVVGEGMSGLMCAQYAAAAGLRVATFEGACYGGLVANIAALEDFDETVSGIDLATRLTETNAQAGVQSHAGQVAAVSGREGAFSVESEAGAHRGRLVVIASGATLSHLGVPGEERLAYRGVSQCADCDGPMFRGRKVVIVGGGDSAFQAAATLSEQADGVTILVRGDRPRASEARVRAALAHSRISVRFGAKVTEVLGEEAVRGVALDVAGGTEHLACDGVFIYVGTTPNVAAVPPAVARAASGHIITDAVFETSQRGVFAIGAVRSGYLGQVTDARNEARQVTAEIVRRLSPR